MAVNTPAQPSTSGLATTTDESRGGFFTDTNGVGIDLSATQGQTGPQGPEGPVGPEGPIGPMGLEGPRPVFGPAVEVDLAPGSAPTVSISGTGSDNDPIILTIGIPRGEEGGAPSFSPTVSVDTLNPGTTATASISGSGSAGDPYVLALGIPRGADGTNGTDGMPGADGISFVPIFFEATFDGLGNLVTVSDPSTTLNTFEGQDVVHTDRAFLRSDNPAYLLMVKSIHSMLSLQQADCYVRTSETVY